MTKLTTSAADFLRGSGKPLKLMTVSEIKFWSMTSAEHSVERSVRAAASLGQIWVRSLVARSMATAHS